jgi:ketosteroid isomerase-like protein
MKRNLLLIAVVFTASLLLLRSQTNQPDHASEPPKSGQAFQTLEQEWADAVKRRDVEAIDRLQADEYVFTDPAGQVWTKTRELDTIKAGDLQIASFELSEVKVRLYDNTAVVTLRIVWHGKFRDTDISGPQRMTDVFVKRDGRWQCVASQATRIPQP